MNTQLFTPGKKLILLIVIGFAVIFSIKLLGPSFAKDNEEREIEDKIPKHLPLKVKLKKEKEDKIKDFKNDAWVLDFELEVTNTSEKPIYFLNIWVLLPEFVSQNGGVKGVPLRYGRMDFIKLETRPLPDDIPIKPGETYTFKILDQDRQAWAVRKAAGVAPNPRKLQFIFSDLSFGDGTGFSGTTGLPYPNKQISQAEIDSRCLEQRAQKQEWSGDVRIGPPDLLIHQPLFETRPAAILPVRFFETTSVPARPPQSGLCCPGTQCSFLKPSTYFCSCGLAQTIDTALVLTRLVSAQPRNTLTDTARSWTSGVPSTLETPTVIFPLPLRRLRQHQLPLQHLAQKRFHSTARTEFQRITALGTIRQGWRMGANLSITEKDFVVSMM